MIPKRKLDFVKSKIIEGCQCQTDTGCPKCRSQISRVTRYAQAGIPADYWLLSFKDFQGDPNFKKLISTQLKDISGLYNDGRSSAFVGNLGTGKTYAATSILKRAIVAGYSAQYYHMDQVIRSSISPDSNEFYKEITGTDFICIDEYDSRWVFPSEKSETLFGQTMESILRFRFQNNMPTIICSNTEDVTKVLAGDFSRTTESLFSKYVKVIYVAGKDFRKEHK